MLASQTLKTMCVRLEKLGFVKVNRNNVLISFKKILSDRTVDAVLYLDSFPGSEIHERFWVWSTAASYRQPLQAVTEDELELAIIYESLLVP